MIAQAMVLTLAQNADHRRFKMTQGVTKAIFIMIAGVLTALLISALFSMSKNGTNSANNVSSKASSLVAQMNYYDLDRVDCRYVTGNEAKRIIERYHDESTIILFTATRDSVHKNQGALISDNGTCTSGCGHTHPTSTIYDTASTNCFIKDESQFYVVVKYDDNEKLEKITITEQ